VTPNGSGFFAIKAAASVKEQRYGRSPEASLLACADRLIAAPDFPPIRSDA
jgi:hypothetical protein